MKWLVFLVILVIAMPGAYRLITRGLPPAIARSPDIRPTFLCALWIQGNNPYSREQQIIQWSQVKGAGEEEMDSTEWSKECPLYPPGLCALVAPLTLLPWKLVRILVLVANLGLCFLAWIGLARVMQMPLGGWRALLFGALWLSVGPFITCIHLANPALPAIMLGILAVCLATEHHDIAAGILIGLSAVIKPQLAGALLLCYMVRGRPRIWVMALSLFCLFEIIGIGRLWIGHVDWVPTLKSNLAFINGPGGWNDASMMNPVRWQLINLQVPLFAILSNRVAVNGLAWAIVAVIGLFYLIALRRGRYPANELLLVGIPLVLCLLPVYHRYYDSLVLVIPIAWSIGSLCTPRRYHAIVILLCTIPFYVSGAFVLNQLQEAHRIPMPLLKSMLWSVLILPHQTWFLILICLVMLHAMWTTNGDQSERELKKPDGFPKVAAPATGRLTA